MFTSASLTLVVITRDRLIRADFASRTASEPSSCVVRPRPETDDAGTLVSTALGFHAVKPRRTFVLTTDAWTHTLELPTSNVAKLPPDELRQMLAFEAEPISGLSAFDAATAFADSGDRDGARSFWVTQIAASARDAMDEAVRAAGGRLAGVLHPGGVPAALAVGASTDSAARVEFWPGAVVRTAMLKSAVVNARVDDAGLASDWQSAAEQWRTAAGVETVETLAADYLAPVADERLIELTDEATLGRWLAAWNRCLSAACATVPTIGPPIRPLSPQTRNAVALAISAVVCGVCYGHHTYVETNLAAVTKELEIVQAPGIELASLTKKTADAEATLKKQQESTQKLRDASTAAEIVLKMHRTRLAELLRRLAAHHDGSWFVSHIDGNSGLLSLRGSTTDPRNVAALTSTLSREFTTLGWALGPADQSLTVVHEDDGLWNFELRFHDVLYDDENKPHAAAGEANTKGKGAPSPTPPRPRPLPTAQPARPAAPAPDRRAPGSDSTAFAEGANR